MKVLNNSEEKREKICIFLPELRIVIGIVAEIARINNDKSE